MKRTLLILALAVATFGLSAPRAARADSIIPTWLSTTSCGVGCWSWNYDVGFSANSQLIAVSTIVGDGTFTPSGAAVLTMYDFWGAFAVDLTLAPGWAGVLTTSPPAPILLASADCGGGAGSCAPDLPGILNVMFTYHGPTTTTGAAGISLGTFSIHSTALLEVLLVHLELAGLQRNNLILVLIMAPCPSLRACCCLAAACWVW